jgi:hypothetical protein
VNGTDSLQETAQKLGEARRILEGVEATALGSVAQMLAETAESLTRTAHALEGISPDARLTFEEAAAYLKKTPLSHAPTWLSADALASARHSVHFNVLFTVHC